MQAEIVAGSVVLKRYEPGFAPLLLDAARASCSPAFTHYAPWCHAAYSLGDSEQFIARCQTDWQEGSAFVYALIDRQTQQLCGGIGLNQFNRTHGFCNLGYWVRPSHQRQGLASHATRCLAQRAFADLPTLHRIELLTLPDNLASQRTALAAGAQREGLLRQRLLVGAEPKDAVLFSLVRSSGSPA